MVIFEFWVYFFVVYPLFYFSSDLMMVFFKDF